MANLVEYLSFPIKKFFNTPEFRSVVKKLTITPPLLVSYPFEFYPEPILSKAGAKFKYTDGTELISYHIKGITPISSGGDGFEKYLCSLNFPDGSPFIFPGSITGMFQSGDGENIMNTPLSVGGVVDLDGQKVSVSSFQINLYAYQNPQQDGSYNYALVINASLENPNALEITGLASFDFEFLLPHFISAPTLFQD